MPEFSLDLRDGLLLAAVLVGIYFVMLWLRLARLRRGKRSVGLPLPPREPAIPQRETADAPEPVLDEAVPAPATAASGDFGAALQQRNLETQVQRMNQEMVALRVEVARLQQEVNKANSSRHVSPLYGEAVSYAHQGLDAQAIAVRCGISVGEAELVVALAREPDNRREPSFGEPES